MIFWDTNPIPLKYLMKRLGLLERNEHRLPMVIDGLRRDEGPLRDVRDAEVFGDETKDVLLARSQLSRANRSATVAASATKGRHGRGATR